MCVNDFSHCELPMSSILTVPAKIEFDEAIELTQVFLIQLKKNELSPSEIQDFVSALVRSANGARGFFVTYLTALEPICDEPRSEIIAALQANPDIVADLLVKNLAMSTAQQIYHQRRNDPEMMASSGTVATRTTKIIQQVNLDRIRDLCRELVQTIHTGNGSYSDFLIRWGYDEEQKQAIDRVFSQLGI
jgi:hypothetical protein